ncbi:MAG: hypothetical protein V4724_26680 [Pseudomonadota bacterium]
MITPTVGRKVWYRPSAYDKSGPGAMQAYGEQPCDATIVAVHSNALVNLAIFDHNGNPHKRTSVTLLQDDVKPNEGTSYAEWMPYQTTQAAKHAAE